MKTYYANKRHTVGGFNQYIVADDLLVLENIKTALGDKKAEYYRTAFLNSTENFYSFIRFDKYIGYVQHNVDLGLWLSLVEFKEMEDSVNLIHELRDFGWTEEQLLIVNKLAYEIINSESEECEVKLIPVP